MTIAMRGQTNTSGGRIKVYLRIRPLNERERLNDARCLEILNEYALIFAPPHLSNNSTKYRLKNARYQFDRIFGFNDDNETVYAETVQALVKNCLDGYDSTVFAYGSTGSGKTHTMMGSQDQPGIIPQAVHSLFNSLSEHEDVKLTVSYLEIYNEEVFDLLTDNRKRVFVMESKDGISVKDLSQHEIKEPDDYLRLLELGGLNRSQSATDSNAQSSRSHAIFQIEVQRKSFANGIVSTLTSHTNLVDLAGSERAAVAYKTNRNKTLSQEGKKINQSLLSLSNCLSKLAMKDKAPNTHIPFRGSKLTLILRESFLGRGQTIMIAAASPSWNSYEETQNTLQYAEKAMGITVSVGRNVATTYTAYNAASTSKIQELEEVIRLLREENRGFKESNCMLAEMVKEGEPANKVVNTPFKEIQPIKPAIAYIDNGLSPADCQLLDKLTGEKVELDCKRTKLEFEKTRICHEKSQHIHNRTLAKHIFQSTIPDVDEKEFKLQSRVYTIQDEINAIAQKLDELRKQIDAEEKTLLERKQNSAEVQLHVKDNLIQFYEKHSKFYEKTTFKFQADQLERRLQESETLHETLLVAQKLYCICKATNILTDELNGDYENLRDRILNGKKEVMFRDALMSTPVANRYNDLKSHYYMPLTTTPLSSKHTTLALVRSVTPVSRHLREKLNANNMATEVKAQPKYVPARKVETAKMVAVVQNGENGELRKRVLRLNVQQQSTTTTIPAKRQKMSNGQSTELYRRKFTCTPRWR